MDQHFDFLIQSRQNTLELIKGLKTPQLNMIPEGFNNHLAWNLGHILVTQQLLMYGLSGLDTNLDVDIVSAFRKGSKANTCSHKLIIKICDQYLSSAQLAREDYHKGLFKKFSSYPTSYGVTLNTIEDAIMFNNVHENIHLGYMMAQKRLVI